MNNHIVAVTDLGKAAYPRAPFHPDRRYPEYAGEIASTENPVYDGFRRLLLTLGLDSARAGAPDWNPLGDFIRPGARVLVKPNLVRHFHPYGLDPAAIVTHASVVRAVCDYVLKALDGSGRLVIADAPLQSCVFKDVLELSGLHDLGLFYRRQGIEVEIRDLRLVRAVAEAKSVWGRVLVQESNGGDPAGYTTIDLGDRSLHHPRPVDEENYRVTCYDPARMSRHHGAGRHEYVIANTLLEADVVINIPKMKTHHKAGVTGALKNFVGINGHKDCLPHHTKGAPAHGGDEYAHPHRAKQLDSWLLDMAETKSGALARKTAAVAHRVLHAIHMRSGRSSYWEGSWHGNDTISRTTIDLNRIVRFASRDGTLETTPRRTVFSVVDGVIAGEKDGPLAPVPKHAGLLLAGPCPVAVDTAMTRLMGFDPKRIPTLRHAFSRDTAYGLAGFLLEEVEIRSDHPRWDRIKPCERGDSLGFIAHKGWRGHVEL